MIVNDTTLTGNLGGNAELKKSSNGTEYGVFSMCHSDKGKDGKDYSFWMRVKYFGGWTRMTPRLLKGSSVNVKGKLSKFTYKNDKGEERELVEIIASCIGIIQREPRKENSESYVPPNEALHKELNLDDVPF